MASRPLPGSALREAFREGYGRAQLRADLLAGVVVGIIALPLSMALAIASGAPPQNGLYTAIVAGAVVAVAGGSRVQVSGPTAAFVVLLAPVSERFGLGGLLVASAMAGAMLVLMGLARLGRLIQFVPYPVTSGFTAGIAVVIATLQLKDFLGLQPGPLPESFGGKAAALARALPTCAWPEAATGAATLALLLLWPRVTKRVPAPLVVLAFMAAAAALATHLVPGFHVDTIATRFTTVVDGVTQRGIPRAPPWFAWPWSHPGAHGAPIALSWSFLREIAPSAFAIAMLGAIESLLSATIADAMIRRRHDPDAELIGQGLGNLVAPFFGGIVATGALARTAANARAGGRSPVAAFAHALFVLLAVVALAPVLGALPMASLAALLLVVAWNMSEARHVLRTLRIAPRSDVIVLLACFLLTVLFDMVVAVTIGVMLAALLFMRRMAEVFDVQLVAEARRLGRPLPREVLLYQIAGPLFFGAARRAMAALERIEGHVRVVVLDLRAVPAIDVSGIINLEATVDRIREAGQAVILAGLRLQTLRALVRAGWHRRGGGLFVRHSFEDGLALAEAIAAGGPAAAAAAAPSDLEPPPVDSGP